MNTSFSLSRKETFSVSMVIFIGFFYFVSLASTLSHPAAKPGTAVFGIMEIKFLCLGLFYWTGAVLFFMLRNPGWIICTATLFNFIVVVLQFVVAVTGSRNFDGFAAIIMSSFLLVILAFIFLFSTESRTKFLVTNKSYLLVIGVYLLLLAVTFLI